jgi:GNAT superfamily N-acetyltransferase
VRIELLQPTDVDAMVAAFSALGWPGKDREQFERYLAEQAAGDRLVLVARRRNDFAGYGTVIWTSAYRPFRDAGIPEVSDLNVLPQFRRQGIATALMDRAEENVATRSAVAGLGVGLYPDYGAAQAMYVRRGYRPDGRGIAYNNQTVQPGEAVRVDDDLVLMLTKALR